MQRIIAKVTLDRVVNSPLGPSDLLIIAREDIEAQLEGLQTMGYIVDLAVTVDVGKEG